jgi:outer membrane protein assembly factor BamC
MKVGVAAFLALALVVGLAGCGSMPRFGKIVKDRKGDYKSARSLPSLEIPPDLAAPGQAESLEVPDLPEEATTYSSYRGGVGATSGSVSPTREAVLTEPQTVRLERAADQQWLVVKAEPEQVWPKVREFWVKNGFALDVEDPKIGILETEWAENRADIPQDPIRRVLGRVLDSVYSAATRDKFRVRLERGTDPGTTEVYLTHRGMEEVSQGESFVWQPRPSDPELEAEMLKRLMVALGVEDRGAVLASAEPQAARAAMGRSPEGTPVLTLNEDFSRAWRRTGLALDKVGFTVEDRDRSKGVYYVRYMPPDEGTKKGFLSRLAFWRDDDKRKRDEYLVSLTGDGETTRVAVLDMQGQPEKSRTAQRIVELLYGELK